MHRLAILFGFGLLLAACGQASDNQGEVTSMDQQADMGTEAAAMENADALTPPDAEMIPYEMTAHGDVRVDPYYWMRDRDNPEVIAYLEAENAYAAQYFDQLEDVKTSIFEELIGHLSESRDSVPFARNGFLYFTRFAERADYSVISRRAEVEGSNEEVLIDGPALAEGQNYFMLSAWDVAPSNTMLAYSIDTNGRELFDIYIRDLTTGVVLEDVIEDTDGSVIWSADGTALYYLRNEDETLRPYQLWRHVVGTAQSEDQMLYQEDDPEFLLIMDRTKSERYLTLTSWLRTSTEVRLVDLADPEAQATVFESRRDPHQYYVDNLNDTFFIHSDENAINFQIFTAPDLGGHPGEWQLLIPHREDTLVQGVEVFDGYLALEERSGGNVAMHVYDLSAGTDHFIDVGGEVGYATFTEGADDVVNIGSDAGYLRFQYSSYNVPTTIYDYGLDSRQLTERRQDEVRGDFDPANYETARVWAPARDGTMVPVTLAWRRDMGGDEPRPLMLRGYGAYGLSYDPTFTYAWLPLMDHGFVLATAHIRGGTEMGRQWYYDGRLDRKINTFTDYIDAADFLVREGWTTQDQMIARGGSAGGLLMGAVVNMRPELFQGVLNHVPFVDVVTTMSDPTIPLTTYEWVEWGNPIEDENAYNYMLSYSPYDQLAEIEYPNMFITAGLNDPRVQYWEPAKYVASVRDLDQGDNILLFKTNMGSGHFGTTGRFSQYEDIAEEITFMMWVLGMTDVPAP